MLSADDFHALADGDLLGGKHRRFLCATLQEGGDGVAEAEAAPSASRAEQVKGVDGLWEKDPVA